MREHSYKHKRSSCTTQCVIRSYDVSTKPYCHPYIANMVCLQVRQQERENEVTTTITKPYLAWVETLTIQPNFRMPKFRMFNSTKNPTQHLASTCQVRAHHKWAPSHKRCITITTLCTIIGRSRLHMLQIFHKTPSSVGKKWNKSFLDSFCNTQRHVGVPKLIERK